MALEQIVETIHKLDQGTEDVEGLVELAVEAEDEEAEEEVQEEDPLLVESSYILIDMARLLGNPMTANADKGNLKAASR